MQVGDEVNCSVDKIDTHDRLIKSCASHNTVFRSF